VRYEEFDVARRPKVANTCAAKMPYQADIGDDETGHEDEDERGGPGGNLVWADAGFR
jgi:hypothetical protein